MRLNISIVFSHLSCDGLWSAHACLANGLSWLMYVQHNEVLMNKMFYKNAVSYWAFIAYLQVRSQAILCGICVVQSGSETGYYWALRFSPVSIILPMLHTHILFSCPPRCKVSRNLIQCNSLNNSPSEWSYNILSRPWPVSFSFLHEICQKRLMQDTTLHKVRTVNTIVRYPSIQSYE